jgi:hypothetical protein
MSFWSYLFVFLFLILWCVGHLMVDMCVLLVGNIDQVYVLPCHMHTNLNFWKFEFFFFGVYSRLIVNSIHYIFFIHFYLFHLLFLIISILSNFICMFILSITSQFSNLSILFITSQLLWCCESWIFVLYWFFFVVYASVLFRFYCCPCPWSIVSKSLFWRNILQNQRWIQLTTFNKK